MRVRVWDLPTRLFHWSFATCVAGAILYGNLGGHWMDWHYRCGYGALALALFRLVWGIVGPRYARFASFPLTLRGTLAYVRGGASGSLGHSPLAAWSVFALILVVLGQTLGGLFAHDPDDDHAGPLAHFIPDALSNRIGDLHALNAWTIYVLVGLHLLAIFWYAAFKREQMIEPMVMGDKDVDTTDAGTLAADDDTAVLARAAVVFGVCVAIVWAISALRA